MNKNIGIIIQREYTTRVIKKSFILTTLLVPFALMLIGALPIILGKMKSGDVVTVAVIDHTGKYTNFLEDTDEFKFITANKTLNQYKEEEDDSDIQAVLSIDRDLMNDPNAISLFSYKQQPEKLETYIKNKFDKYLTDKKISSYKEIPNLQDIIKNIEVNVGISTYKWDKSGNIVNTSSDVSNIIGIILTILSYMFIMTYGSMVLQGVLEEKKNKIMEVMVSTVKPFDMMMGKIIGIGLVGITQMLMWGILFVIILFISQFILLGNIYDLSSIQNLNINQGESMIGKLSPSELSDLQSIATVLSGINFFEIFILFILFFIGGYLLYSSLCAAIGSAVSSEEDTSQLMIPITIIMLFSFYAGMGSIDNPDGPLAFWCSFIPFTSSIVMMTRLPYDVPIWQEILSVSLLYLTFIYFTWISSRIYRIGILMYGKKPTLKELWKWVKYK